MKGEFKLYLEFEKFRLPESETHFLEVVPGRTYELKIEEDPTVKTESKPIQFATTEDLNLGSSRMKDLTQELKNMTTDQLKARGAEYQRLIEARDVEDILFSGD